MCLCVRFVLLLGYAICCYCASLYLSDLIGDLKSIAAEPLSVMHLASGVVILGGNMEPSSERK